jgi:sodium transport system ATP-binding protein
MIEIQQLCKRFGGVAAVDGVSFTAPDGAITGLLGANGAGKTTTLGMITGLLAPDAGTVAIGSTATNGRERRSLIGALLDHQGLYPRLTARENIAYFGALQGLSGPTLRHRVDDLVGTLGLAAVADRRVDGFSRGERLKVALGRAIVHAPQHLVLDEPTNGLDVASIHTLRVLLRRLREQGRCVVFSSHVLEQVAALCDHVVIMARGRLVAHGSVDALCARTGAATLEDAFLTLTAGEA